MSLVFRFLFCALLISPGAWAEDPLPAPIDVEVEQPVEVAPGFSMQRWFFKVRGVFRKGAPDRLQAIRNLPTEEQRKAEFLRSMAQIMKVPETKIEAMILEIKGDQAKLAARKFILEENKKALGDLPLYQMLYGYNSANGFDPARPLGLTYDPAALDYDPAKPLGLDGVPLDEAKLAQYLDPKDLTLKLALIRLTVNGVSTSYSLYRGGNGLVLSFILGPVVGMISASFTVYQNKFTQFMSTRDYFEKALLAKAEVNQRPISKFQMAMAKRLDSWAGGAMRKWMGLEGLVNAVIYAPLAYAGTLAKRTAAFIGLDYGVTTALDGGEQGVYEVGTSFESSRKEQAQDIEYFLTGDLKRLAEGRSRLQLKMKILGLLGSLVGTILKIDKMAVDNYVFPKISWTIPHTDMPIEATVGIAAAVGIAWAYTGYQYAKHRSFSKTYQQFWELLNRSSEEASEELSSSPGPVCPGLASAG